MMFARAIKVLVSIVVVSIITACVSIGNTHLLGTQEEFKRNYPQIKQIAIEEAANNGFGTLTSEVKPSEFNNWEGELFFQLNTANGTDQLFVTFRNLPQGVDIWVHGAGTRSNPDSAAKAIAARLTQLK
jgi:hypothetical protein